MEKAGKAVCAEGRLYCYRCMRAERMCLCELLSGCHTRTEIHILQHRRERQHAFGTVRLLKIGLSNVNVYELNTHMGKSSVVPDGFPLDAGVLYPGPGSRDLATLSPEERPDKLVVIDGTWSQAHCMYRDNPWLQGLTRYSLRPAKPSRYLIRKEPSAECLSTLESTVMALNLLEPENTGVASLSYAFDQMNERQVKCVAENSGVERRMKRPRDREMRAVPTELWEDPSRIVIVYGESAKPAVRRDKKTREVAQWSALRLTEPERTFDHIVSTKVPMPSDRFLGELGWTESDLKDALPFDEVDRKWREFLRDDDIVVAWNKGTFQLAKRHGMLEGGIMLKGVYGNITKDTFGTLDDVVTFESLSPLPLPNVVGRAAWRLGNAFALTWHLIEWARAKRNASPSA